jgi:hypothetical protein
VQRVFVLADGLTVALEVGAEFAVTGLPVLTTTNLDFPVNKLREEAALVIDTEIRPV